MKVLLILLTIVAQCHAVKQGEVEYVDDGAIITKEGLIKLNNPDPMVIEMNADPDCWDELYFCYKKLDKPTNSRFCAPDYCYVRLWGSVADTFLTTNGADKGRVRYIINPKGPWYCHPDVSDGYHYWHFQELPDECEIKVLGATDPNPTKEKKDGHNAVKYTIWFFFILLMGVLFFIMVLVTYILLHRINIFEPEEPAADAVNNNC